MNILEWLKKNWLVVILAVAILVLIGKQQKGLMLMNSVRNVGVTSEMAIPYAAKEIGMPSPIRGEAAPVMSDTRMVVQDTNMSMLVNDVDKVAGEIANTAKTMGGYMVSRSVSKPEGAASGYITIRVPAEKREEALLLIKNLGVKVVSENVYGDDVTDQYVDIETRVANLEKTKARLMAISDQATNVQDLIQVQNQIDNIQQQIDSLKGQQKYLEQTAKLTRITINLSTDELALPYAPDKAWRPAVVFKTAVRSMIGALRNVVDTLIWLVVYLPVFLILLGLVYLGRWVYRKYLLK